MGGLAPALLLLNAVAAAVLDDTSTSDIFDIINDERLLVSSVTKLESSIDDAPAAIYVITREDIEKWGYASVLDALRQVPGLYAVDDGIVPNLAVRGISGGPFAESSVVKVMIDGNSVAFRPTSGNWLGPELVAMSAIERIEVVRGPVSALYGADAFLGTINIVTKARETGVKVRTYGGATLANPTYGVDAAASGKIGPLQLLLSGRYDQDDRSGSPLPSTSPQPRISPVHSGDLVTRHQILTSKVASLKLSYQHGDHSYIELYGRYSQIDRGAELATWEQLTYGADSGGRFSQTLVSLYQGQAGFNGKEQLASIVDLAFAGQGFMAGPTSSDVIELGEQQFDVKRRFGSLGANGYLELHLRPLANLQLVTGGEIVFDRETPLTYQRVATRNVAGVQAGQVFDTWSDYPAPRTLLNPAAYAQATWQAIPRYLSAIGGVRYDYHNIYGNQLNARAGAVSHPVDRLGLKLLYGTAFKAPSPLLLYATPIAVGDITGNPALKPQLVHTVEGEIDYSPVKALSLQTNLAYSTVLNMAEFSLRELNQVARNVASMSSLSWETRVEASHEDWLQGRLGATLNWTERKSNEIGYVSNLFGANSFIYPPLMLNAGGSVRFPVVPVRLSVSGNFISQRPASQSNSLFAGEIYKLPAYVTLDVYVQTVGLHIFGEQETSIALSGKNLLGVVGPDPGFSGVDYPLAPRKIMLVIRQVLQ